MPYLASTASPIRSSLLPGAQPILRAGEQQYPLTPGVHPLGGRAPDAVPLAALQSQPRAATLTVSDEGVVILQRTTASVVVRVDGDPIGIAPIELRGGTRIEFGDCRVWFETEAPSAASSARSTTEQPAAGATTEASRAPALNGSVTGGARPNVPAWATRSADAERTTDAALVEVKSGMRHPLPMRRISIGRDDSCDVIVRGNSVSRRHATIAPVAGGFLLRDESANGTLVNGIRIVGTYLLANGDVVRVQDEELRVELDAAAPAPIVRGDKTTQLDLSHITRGVTEEQARAAAVRPVTASLEIVRGPFTGASFQVDRAVCSIGRGDDNDVRIHDDTVSLSHATLLRKAGVWFVVDLRSMNGTYVDGSRVSGERELHPGACVRLGAVELVFRAIDSVERTAQEAPRTGFWAKLKGLLRIVMPPLE
jgi:pSer/pThr/pTyr-binding forkhead associated (FHA) protein